METLKRALSAAAVAVLMAGPALACIVQPEQKWSAIDAALPRAKLSDTDRARVAELRARALGLLADARKDATRRDTAKYHAADVATREAIEIVGLVHSPTRLRSGCGGTYTLKSELQTN